MFELENVLDSFVPCLLDMKITPKAFYSGENRLHSVYLSLVLVGHAVDWLHFRIPALYYRKRFSDNIFTVGMFAASNEESHYLRVK